MGEQNAHYVVLLGAVGSGKSTIVGKVTGQTSGDNSGVSATRKSQPLWAEHGELIICDTPGSNSIGDKFGQNIWIATAFNFRPVSKIFIIVKADCGRLDSVISGIRDFSDRFVDIPNVPLGVIVTHMDLIKWTASPAGHQSDIKAAIKDETDIDDVIFSDPTIQAAPMTNSILGVCSRQFNLTVNHDNFLRLFTKLHKSRPMDVLRACQREVDEFKKKRQEFITQRNSFDRRQQVDLVFEFQAFMTQEITRAQVRLSDQHSFSFTGAEAENEAAHISNMSNQMLAELRAIRIETLAYQRNHGVSNLRKCPLCGQVWTKVEGCDGTTTCGAIPKNRADGSCSVMATFTFSWNDVTKKLSISQSGTKSAKSFEASARGAGCGGRINWSSMATVELPTEFNSTVDAVKTSDVSVLPPSAANFNQRTDDRLDSSLREMTLGPRPNASPGEPPAASSTRLLF